MPMSSILLSGILTGIVSSLAIVIKILFQTPADHTRIMMQKQNINNHNCSIKAGKHMYINHGLKGLYLGFFPTLLR